MEDKEVGKPLKRSEDMLEDLLLNCEMAKHRRKLKKLVAGYNTDS